MATNMLMVSVVVVYDHNKSDYYDDGARTGKMKINFFKKDPQAVCGGTGTT